MLRSGLCDLSDAYIVVKGDIALKGDNNANKQKKKKVLHLKLMQHLSTTFQRLMV